MYFGTTPVCAGGRDLRWCQGFSRVTACKANALNPMLFSPAQSSMSFLKTIIWFRKDCGGCV